jgi:16S rRNA processing protein RimM
MTVVFEFQEVAKLGKSRGIDGGIKFVGKLEVFAYFLKIGHLFIKMKDGSPVPFNIVHAEEKGDYILFLDGVDTPEKAKELTGCSILLDMKSYTQELAPTLPNSNSPNAYIGGFLLKDKTSGYQNRVDRIEQYPQQEMLVMESGHLVPFHEDFIVQIDKVASEIVMELPHGLFDE